MTPFYLSDEISISSVSPSVVTQNNIDRGFLEDCLDAARPVATLSVSALSLDDTLAPASLPPSPSTTLASPTSTFKAVLAGDEERLSHLRHLLASYKAAITDFYGSGTPCIYKTGPTWPVAPDRSPNFIRAARPIYNRDIAPTWIQTVRRIASLLDSLEASVKWNTIDPLAYANAGDAAIFCNFVVVISVDPCSLAFEAAKAAAEAVEGLLESVGFPDIEVAIVESVYRRRYSKFMSFDPTYQLQGLSVLQKPFTPTLGLSIAPHKMSNCEGTGGVFFRLSSDQSDKRVALLTCAHVARPPTANENIAYTRKVVSQPREDIILLGDESFNESIGDIMKFIGDETDKISTWETALSKFPPPSDNEDRVITAKRIEIAGLIAGARARIDAANDLHSHVTKFQSYKPTRVLGSVLHCAKVEVGEDGFMHDWALIQLDTEKLEEEKFKGNKLFVGGNKTTRDWQNYMFAQAHDRRDFHVPEDLLLQLQGYVPKEEFHSPHHYDIHNHRVLLAVKNGRTTGTTFGRVNGLESLTREGIGQEAVDALEVIVCGYDTKTGKIERFSAKGDSGSMVVDRLGRLIGLLTGGGGATDETDKTYVTPFYSLRDQIAKTFKDAHLLPAVGS